jgi:phosphomannomutase
VGFLVKRSNAAAGVVVTASHNPPEYNGYKVYWENAAQIVPPVDSRIAAAIDRAPSAREVVRPKMATLRSAGAIVDTPADTERQYLEAVRALAVHPTGGDRAVRVVYTALHGVGDALVRRGLREAGFMNVTSVAEQAEPDGSFPTVNFPNPEEPGAMDLALALAHKTKADLVLANDPDADRLGVAVSDPSAAKGDAPTSPGPAAGSRPLFRQLTGNEIGVLLGHYLLSERPSAGPQRRAVIASIVSSPLLGRIAKDLGAHYEETLTGFKWIANRAIELEREGFEFVFGYEEALGYCVGSAVRDKDGISAALLFAEMAAVLRSRGLSPAHCLDDIARRWGVYTSTQLSVTKPGASGRAEIETMMEALRKSPPMCVAGDDVVAVIDYEARVRAQTTQPQLQLQLEQGGGGPTALALPASNVLALELASGSRIVARPSGTEPKAKFYFDVREDRRSGESVRDATARAHSKVAALAQAFAELARLT